MIFDTNIKSFLDGAAASSSFPIVGVYCFLIGIELTLKRALQSYGGHDVPGLLTRLVSRPEVSNAVRGAGKTHAQRLRACLGSIATQSQSGTPTKCPPDSYPYIRYSLLAVDGCSVPNVSRELAALYVQVRAILQFFKENKVELSL
jgi:hypothetical protein